MRQCVDTAQLQPCKSATNDETLGRVDMNLCIQGTEFFLDCIQQGGTPCGSKLGDSVWLPISTACRVCSKMFVDVAVRQSQALASASVLR
mmetsp:Transcript_65730/g.174206  ORF Transcript_65730/g.174206 Transcript_65730/m.174206 type:complete len:90 (+) Transcript_65730:1382-1651(+)